MNGILLLFILFNMICVGIGAFNATARFLGACFAPFLCLTHFGIIISTGVFRFSDYGKLCALSKLYTNYTSSDEPADDAWTYEKDGTLILALWIIQLLFFTGCCFVSTILPIRPMGGGMATVGGK